MQINSVEIIVEVSLLIIATATYFGFKLYDKLIDWFVKTLGKNPIIRKWLLFSGILISIFLGGFAYDKWDYGFVFLIIFVLYFLVILPSAISSILLDDIAREKVVLPLNITKKQIIDNPQSAIQHAFVNLEDKLRKKVGRDDLFGETLINAAYGNNGQLMFSENENNLNVRNLFSGAYSLYRNSRQHRLMDDDVKSAEGIINLINLLWDIVEKSEKKNRNEQFEQ